MAKLIDPADGTSVEMLTEVQRKFLTEREHAYDAGKIDWAHLSRVSDQDDTQPPLQSFQWETEEEESVLELSEDADFKVVRTFRTTQKNVRLHNFKAGQKYYWRVNGCEPFCFTTETAAPRWIDAEGLTNVRDAGGWRTKCGRCIRQGMLYRGSEMDIHHTITHQGRETLRSLLGIRTDLDLRGEASGYVQSPLGPDIAYICVPVAAYQEYMREYHAETKKIFDFLCEEQHYPIYYHCWGGADRTGTVAFLLGAVLGMEEEDLMLDYELTSLAIWGERSCRSESFRGFLQELGYYAGNSIQERAVNYLHTCGVTEEQMQKLRDLLLE